MISMEKNWKIRSKDSKQ